MMKPIFLPADEVARICLTDIQTVIAAQKRAKTRIRLRRDGNRVYAFTSGLVDAIAALSLHAKLLQ